MTATADALGIDIGTLDAARERNATLPAHWYYDPAIHAFEMDEIWDRNWVLAGTLSAIPNRGDFLVTHAGSVPIIVARGKGDQVNAYVNACPHRAYPMAMESGTGATEGWTCFYHGWEFALDGKLTHAPRTDIDPGFDPSKCELRKVSMELWGESIFVNADPNAPSLHEAFPNLEAFAEREGLDPTFSDYEMFDKRHYEIGANWKIFMDNWLECYHCPTVHAETLYKGFDGEAGQWEYTTEGSLFSTHFVPDPEARDQSYFYASLQAFPGYLIIQHNDFGVLFQSRPTAADKFEYTGYFYRQKGSSDEAVNAHVTTWDETFVEDFDLMETHQRNVEAVKFAGHGYIRQTELLVIQFNNVLWDAYKKALGGNAGTADNTRRSIARPASEGVSLP